MNPGLLILPFAAWVATLARRRSPLLLVVWVVGFLAFPTTRNRLGPVSIYWCDLAAAALLYVWVLHPEGRPGSTRLDRWVVVLLGALTVGFFSAFARHGAYLQPGYTILRHVLAISPLLIVPRVCQDPRAVRALAGSVLACALIMGAVAVGQSSSVALATRIEDFFYGDYERATHMDSESGSNYRLGLVETSEVLRVYGMYAASTSFGGVCALIAALTLLLTYPLRQLRRVGIVASGLSMLASFLSYSRHSMLALAIFGIAVSLSNPRRIASILGAGAVVVSLGAAVVSVDFIEQRWGRGGIDEDDNLYLRLVQRPLELLERVEREPSVGLVGVGLGAFHIAARDRGTDVEFGFASNSFLLYLFYSGLPAFLVIFGIFLAAGVRAAGLRAPMRGLGMGAVLAAVVVQASDNYAFFHSSVAFLWSFIFATIYVLPHVSHRVERSTNQRTVSTSPSPTVYAGA